MADEQASGEATGNTSTRTGQAATATIGGAAVVATGEPTKWLWNDLLNWIVSGASGPLPVMPDPVAAFFGAVLLAGCYGAVRVIRKRMSG